MVKIKTVAPTVILVDKKGRRQKVGIRALRRPKESPVGTLGIKKGHDILGVIPINERTVECHTYLAPIARIPVGVHPQEFAPAMKLADLGLKTKAEQRELKAHLEAAQTIIDSLKNVLSSVTYDEVIKHLEPAGIADLTRQHQVSKTLSGFTGR